MTSSVALQNSALMIPLADLPLRPSTNTLLQQRGFVNWREVHESKLAGIATLAAELNVDTATASSIYQEVASLCGTDGSLVPDPTSLSTKPNSMSAKELLKAQHRSQQNSHIVTFSQSIDAVLGGGVPLGSLTELAGLPGTGKTQLATQIAVTARLPHVLGGVQGQTLYIDTEGSFSPERCYQMAAALARHAKNTLKRRKVPIPEHPPLTAESFLDHIHVLRVHDEASQSATIYDIPRLVKEFNLQQPDVPVRLVVVDSIAFHYRAAAATATSNTTCDRPPSYNPHNQNLNKSTSNYSYYMQRTKALANVASLLGDLAHHCNLAVVAINQMTTKLVESGNGSSSATSITTSRWVPALGESWAHAVCTRVILFNNRTSSSSSSCCSSHKDGNASKNSTSTTSTTKKRIRSFRLVKSPCRPNGEANFQVLPEGIRDVQIPRRERPLSQPDTEQAGRDTLGRPHDGVENQAPSAPGPDKQLATVTQPLESANKRPRTTL